MKLNLINLNNIKFSSKYEGSVSAKRNTSAEVSSPGFYPLDESEFWQTRTQNILCNVAPFLYLTKGEHLRFDEFRPFFDCNEDFLEFKGLFDDKNYKEFKDLVSKDGISRQDAVNIAFRCIDKERFEEYFKLYPGQKDAILKYLKDPEVPQKAKAVAVSVSSDCVLKNKAEEAYHFDSKLYNRVMETFVETPELVRIMNILGFKNYVKFLDGRADISKMNVKQVLFLKSEFDKIREALNEGPIRDSVDKALLNISSNLNKEDVFLPVNKAFMDDFISSVTKKAPKGALNGFENVMVQSIPYLKTLKNGIGLEYPRDKFLSDLEKLADNKDKRKILEEKTGISLLTNKDGEITGYNGIPVLQKLDRENGFENGLYNLFYKFLYENGAKTESDELNQNINLIIRAFPEFINTIGKKQNRTHQYTLDVHSLLVLAYSIQNPDYAKLDGEDKFLLKMASIFHDILKAQDIIDSGHQRVSSSCMAGILKKTPMDNLSKDRLVEFIKNHHWLKEYQTSENKAQEAKRTAFKFRRLNDFCLAKIMAKSDLKAVSDRFYLNHRGSLKSENLQAIEKEIETIKSTGCALFLDDSILDEAKNLTIENYKGKEYRVFDAKALGDDFNSEDGPYFLCHMVSNLDFEDVERNFNITKETINLNNVGEDNDGGGVLSCSLITPKYDNTFGDRKFGLILSSSNSNIIGMSKNNQRSGFEKSVDDVIRLIFNGLSKNGMKNSSRIEFKTKLLSGLQVFPENAHDSEYSKFYSEVLECLKTLDDILDETEYEFFKTKFTGKELKDVIKQYQADFVKVQNGRWNEIICYAPKIRAVAAKAESINEIPDGVLKFASDNDLPIVLI